MVLTPTGNAKPWEQQRRGPVTALKDSHVTTPYVWLADLTRCKQHSHNRILLQSKSFHFWPRSSVSRKNQQTKRLLTTRFQQRQWGKFFKTSPIGLSTSAFRYVRTSRRSSSRTFSDHYHQSQADQARETQKILWIWNRVQKQCDNYFFFNIFLDPNTWIRIMLLT